MFEFVRKHSKIFMVLMFLLIIPSFVLLGVDGYTRNAGSDETVARVGGKNITRAEWDAAHNNMAEQMRVTNPTLDAKQLDSPQARYISLEKLVQERVLATAATKDHLVTSDVKLVGISSLEEPMNFILPSLETVSNHTYLLSRNLYMYTLDEPEGLMKTYLDWIMGPEAQEIAHKLGFMPVLNE